MKNNLLKITFTAITCIIALTTTYAQQLAFPGAVGFGSFATGGRGGTVYHVTNLNDAGTGSFRDAVSASNRIVVFDVGGYVSLATAVSVKSNITIAGQTAPGDGIGFMGREVSFSTSTNVIVRYVRFRQGDLDPDASKSGINFNNASNMIFDHVSVEFAQWNNIDAVGASNITFQYCITADPIGQQFAAHTETGPYTWYNCLFANSHNRCPLAKDNTQYINNVVYNYQAGYTAGNTAGLFSHDLIGNYFITGPRTTSASNAMYQVNNQSFYMSGNILDSNNDGVLNGSTLNAPSGTITLSSPWSSTTASIPAKTAALAYADIIAKVGASLHRDQVDALVIADVTSLGTKGDLWASQTTTGLANSGYGTLNGGTAPTDTDKDGMPDSWETANGLNPNSASDANTIGSDGYSNIEKYINSLVSGTAAATLTKHGTGAASQTVTLGTALTSFYYTWANATSVTVSGLPSGVTSTLDATAKTVTISGTPAVTGTFNYTITTTGGSPNASVGGTIIVNSGSTSTLIYQGENAVINTGVAETTNAGYTGTGYANTDNAIGTYVEWTVTTSTAGSFSIFFRYASVGDRPADIYVNGTKVISALAFPTTVAWTTWSTTATQTVTLLNGANKIRATATTSGGCANLDYLQVTGSGTLKSADVNVSTIKKEIELYPNPVTNAINISGSLSEKGNITVYIYNQLGDLVDDKNFGIIESGTFKISLPANNIKPGMYVIKVQISTDVKTLRFLKL